jgi:broad specificity phosphatase PhoE
VRAIEEIHAERETGIVALFTHSDTIRLAVAHYLRMPLAAYHALVADPASVSVLYYAKQTVHIAGLNVPAGSRLPMKPE